MGKIKILSVSLCLVIPMLINNLVDKNKVNLKEGKYKILPKKSDSIYLINKSHTELKFYYEDKYLDRHQFHLLPDSTFEFFCDDMQIVTQTNENQNFYLFYPGDTLYATVSSKGNAIFSVKNDSVRNNELNLQWKINEGTPLNFMKVLEFRV